MAAIVLLVMMMVGKDVDRSAQFGRTLVKPRIYWPWEIPWWLKWSPPMLRERVGWSPRGK